MNERPAALLTQFGKYLLDGEIATGGMSKVFRARLRGPGGFEKRLVVKQILPQLAQDPNFIRMFVQEANTLVQMSHPNIVPVYELGVVDGVYFLAMELVEGATLAEILRDGPLPEAWVAHIGIQISEALHYAHDRFAVIHRDVTPRNLLIDDAGHARLLDFGIAAPADQAGRFGSIGYMSPEQARGLPVGPESDLFSVGTLLFEALSGKPAYLRDSAEATRRALLDEPTPRLSEGQASNAMRQWVTRCLARQAHERPRSAAELAKGLRGLLAASHPGGVAEELGRRAQQARQQSELRAHSDHVSTSDEVHSTPTVPGKNRTLATSPILDQLMQQGTERITRSSAPPPAMTPSAPTTNAANLERTAPISVRPGKPEDIRHDAAIERPSSSLRRWLWPTVAALIAVVVFVMNPSAPQTAQPASDALANVAGAGSAAAVPSAPIEPAAPMEPAAAIDASTSTMSAISVTGTAQDLAIVNSVDANVVQAARDAGTTVATTSARATLAINALPWAEVRLDGRALGATPLRKVMTDAGKHTLDVSCPPLGRSARVPLVTKSGETLRVLIDLNQEPPKITLK